MEISKEVLSKEKPFSAFLKLIGTSLSFLKGEILDDKIDFLIQFSLDIGDEVSALQCCSYGLTSGRGEYKEFLKVRKNLLNENQMAFYYNTSIIEDYQRKELKITFLDDFKLYLNKVDCIKEIVMRKKLRKIFSYLIYAHPKSISREELKRVFWNKNDPLMQTLI